MRASDSSPTAARLARAAVTLLLVVLPDALLAEQAGASIDRARVQPVSAGQVAAQPNATDARRAVATEAARLAEAAQVSPPARRTTRRIAIEGLDEPLANWRVSDFDGRDLSAELLPERTSGGVTVALDRPKQFVMKPRSIATLASPERGRLTLPGGVVVPLAGSNGGFASGGAAWFRLTFEASPMPAPWDLKAAGYVTRLTFGLRRPPQVDETVQLDRPVIIKLSYEGLTADELPALAIDAPGLEHEKTVELRFKPSTSAPRLLVRSTISDVNLALSALPRLEVRPQQRTMLGYGLETVTVVVENVSAEGAPRAMDTATPVVIELAGGARAEGAVPELAAGAASASFRLRSAGVGPATITATAGGVSGSAVIEQRFPSGALLAALLGGALGGFARRFMKGARRALTARRILEGALVALVAFVAGVLGVGHLSLPASVIATEAGAFLTGALTGFAGVVVLETITKKRGEVSG